MLSCGRIAILAVVAWPCLAQPAGEAVARELSAEARTKEAAEARAKRNAQNFELRATTLTFLDRSGKKTGQIGGRALYDVATLSPDGKRLAVVKEDLDKETADLFVLDATTGVETRLTTSARTEFVMSPVWSPDGKRIAYVTIRKGLEGIYTRAADGTGPEEMLYKNPGAFVNLTDWSAEGRFLTFAKSDLSGGVLYTLDLKDNPEQKAVEVRRSELRMFGPRFSPNGRFLAYMVLDKANKVEVFVQPLNAPGSGPWQISDGAMSMPHWRRDGKELYYVARDQSVMVSEVSTSSQFSFSKPKVLFKQPGVVQFRLADISADGERIVTMPPPRGQQLQQITIFDRSGAAVRKVGEPGLYSQPAFSHDGRRLVLLKGDPAKSQFDVWTIDLETGKSARITNDTHQKTNLMWSPDGKNILYSSFRNEFTGIYRKAADGSGEEELLFRYTPGAFVGLSDISRDGNTLVCGSGGVILVVPLTGNDRLTRKEIETLRDEFDESMGRLSPDGRFLAYRSDEAKPERGEVYVRTYNASTGMPGEGKWQVSKDGAFGMLNWRGDGKEMFFRGMDLDSSDLVMMSVDVTTSPTFRAGTPKVLFRLPGPVFGNLDNVSRDGQRFVFAINVPAVGAVR